MIDRCPTCQERVFFTTSLCPNCGSDRNQVQSQNADNHPAPSGSKTHAAATLRPAAVVRMLMLVMLALGSFLLDWNLVSKSGSIDYRNRVTGVRLLSDGKDPYHTKWNPGDPAQFCDPYENPALPITKTTVTPAMLVTGLPWASLPYPKSQVLWLLAQWGMLAGLWFLWFTWPGHTPASRWWWSLMVVGFTYTLAWRHHVDRGQAYLLWTLGLSVWLRLGMAKPAKTTGWLAGLLAGLLVCLRPPLFLVIAPFVFLRRRNQCLAATAGLLLGMGAPILMKPTVWQDYGKAMDTWSAVYRSHSEPRPGPRAFPPVVEGMPIDHLANYQVARFADSSIFRLFYAWRWNAVPAAAALGLLGIMFSLWLWWSRGAGDAKFLLGLAAWSFFADAFLPAYRYPYADVMILNTLALFPLIHRKAHWLHWLALAAILTGISLYCIPQPERWWIYLPTLAMAAVAVLALWFSVRSMASASNPSPTS